MDTILSLLNSDMHLDLLCAIIFMYLGCCCFAYVAINYREMMKSKHK